MIIDNPKAEHIPTLRALWQQAFGDSQAFLDCFFETGFAYDRCRCVFREGQPVAAVYLFDGTFAGEKIAYLYALAVEKHHQKQGLSRLLLADTHAHLQQSGYAGAVMEPATESLGQYYARLGYRSFGGRKDHSYQMGNGEVPVTELGDLAYEQLRQKLLPSGGIAQEGAMTRFLQSQAKLFGGEGFVAAVSREENRILEFLGQEEKIPGLLKTLHMASAVVRTCGGAPQSMYLDFSGRDVLPAYFGLPMD